MTKITMLSIILVMFSCAGSKSSGVKDGRCFEGSCLAGSPFEGANATFSPFKVPNAPEGAWTLKLDAGTLDPRTGLRLVKFSWSPYAFAKRYKLIISLDKDCINSYKSYELAGIFYDQNYGKEVLLENGIKLYACLTAILGDEKAVPAENSPQELDFSASSKFKFSLVSPLPRLISSPTKISWTEMPEAAKYEIVLLDGKGNLIREYKDLLPTGPVMSIDIRDLPEGKYQLILNGIDKKGNKFRSLVNNQLSTYDFIYSQNSVGQWATLKGGDGVNPSPRTESVMTALPDGLLLWGGATTQGLSSEGWIYKLNTKLWEKLSPASQPEPRRASSVWTGSQLMVWGGRNFNKFTFNYSKNFGDGGLYNPIGNTWSPIPATDAPTPRYGHTLTSIGASVLVWGGVDRPSIDEKDASTLGNGGIFDVNSKVWTPINATPITQRAFHCSVWTGSQLLVFGGIRKTAGNDSLLVNAGEIFDPTTMIWKSMNDKGQPTPRFAPACVWTGKKMLVWGGSIGFTTVANGAAYDPQTDSWTPMEDNNAPFSFRSETSLWTGKYLLVWGGGDGSGTFNQLGALYNPETNKWQHLSLAGAPSARWSTQAVAKDNQVYMYSGDTIDNAEQKGVVYDELFQLTLP